MDGTDEALAARAAAGEAAAFAILLERVYDRLYALCFRLTGVRSEAEDLCQDICASLPSKLRQFDGRSKVTTWLYRVAVNAAHDRRRRQSTHSRAISGWGDWELARQAANAETAAQVDWLTETMRALPQDLRDTLALILDDLTHKEVAEVLGVSEGTISWRVSIAKKQLRALRQKEESA